ncbi:glycosyl hydrolase 108 family protein [Agrobacterium tumefaciens]|uniref:glycosyl hydrolase 108 family protein n=1 Tax=Agrobacterium tumefaciens TaxID=358 RepID=UPI0009D5517E|nr:glycosyl hydrolase 108 family protein [Agrobacterium tumefaciens]CUX63003.1 hypothetical protein AGR6A_Lc190022 [Agrobacterium sp. NCPPB 925]
MRFGVCFAPPDLKAEYRGVKSRDAGCPTVSSYCHNITAEWEGGWSNHKADPGGKTMYGVTEAVYHVWL